MLEDAFGRQLTYLRLSVTDACNYRCVYCLPGGYRGPDTGENVLTAPEIERLVRAFAALGMWKVRLTGGEPTVRRDIVDIASRAAAVPGVRKVALSTNGYRLSSLVRELHGAGVRALNVSVNSLCADRYRQITGHDRLPEVLRGIDLALEAGFEAVKVNVVLLKDFNDLDLQSFLDWTRTTPVAVRFIELMPTGGNQAVQGRRMPVASLETRLVAEGWQRRVREEGDGPAVELTHPAHRGSIGYIAPYDHGFCGGCNRLRVTSRGGLRLCLFGEGGFNLRPMLQTDEQQDTLRETIVRLLRRKEASHQLEAGRFGDTPSFAALGG